MVHAITKAQIQEFETYLRMDERSASTIAKYTNAITDFYQFLPEDKSVTKEQLLAWKAYISGKYSASAVNVMISAANGFFEFVSWNELKIRQIRTQRQIFRDKERELTRTEYMRLLTEAQRQGNFRLFYLMQTLASTGIRISELKYITAETLKSGVATVDCKGKRRTVLIPKKLRKSLQSYCESANITGGPVFVTRDGNPVNRSNIWRELRKLSSAARVPPHKVFPHNFRHLFAVTFYRQQKDIAKLADLLGHASIDTTRIYIMESGAEHERQIERLGLVI